MRTLCLAFVVLLLSAPVAEARRLKTFNYSYDRVWSSAVRLMRVDYNSPITEKEREDGYFLFNFPHQGKDYSGSIELARVRDGGVAGVRVAVQIGQMPEYVEMMILGRLEKKLKSDFGPPRSKKPEPDEEPPAAPEEGDKGKETPPEEGAPGPEK